MKPQTMPLLLLQEEIPDDDAFLDEMLALLDRTASQTHGSPEHRTHDPPPKKKQPKLAAAAGRVTSSIMFYGALAVVLLAALVFNGGQGEVKNLLGFSYFTVMTPSMQSSIPTGSLIITKKTETSQLEVGDVITFYSNDGETTVTHRVMEIVNDGELLFRTKGDDNPSPDPEPVPAKRVIGKVVFNVQVLGKVLLLLQKHIGWVLVIFFLLVGMSFTLQQLLRKDEAPRRIESKGRQLTNRTGILSLSHRILCTLTHTV